MQHNVPFFAVSHVSFFVMILMMLFFAFAVGMVIRLAMPRLKSGATGWFVLFGLMTLGLIFFGFLFLRAEHRVIYPPVEVVASMPQFVHPEPSLPPLEIPAPPAPVPSGESIEEIWKKLTAPRINLEEVAEAAASDAPRVGPSSPQELTDAAKVILSASLPGADPFTQGWLVNAAKSILGMPVSEQDKLDLQHVALEALTEDSQATDAESKPSEDAADPLAHGAEVMAVTTIAQQPQHDAAQLAIAKSIAALPKPDWVLNPPKQIGNVRKFVLESDPYATEEECRRELDEKMQKLVLDRAIELSQASFSGNRFGDPNLHNLGLGEDYIRRELCTDEFVDTVNSSVGEMKKSYVLLEFNEAQDALLVDRARTHARREGLVDTTLLAAFAFGSVAALFGLFKIDTWTRGYYTKRLFLGVPAAIITVLTLLMLSGV
jgi:hypothetical protein